MGPCMKGVQVFPTENPLNSHKVNNIFFLLLINVMIITICVYWFELFSQVSDVALGSLVEFVLLFFYLKCMELMNFKTAMIQASYDFIFYFTCMHTIFIDLFSL